VSRAVALPVLLSVLAALTVLTVAVFGQVLSHEFLHYDDGVYVTENLAVRDGLGWESIRWAFTSSYRSNWTPLTWLSHMLDVELFGMQPAGHHGTNLLLHLANTLLLFALLRRMTGALRRSALVAALFAIHPLHVESVVWIATRKDLLSTLFGLLAIWFYVSWVQESRSRDQALALLFAAMGLMAKQMLVTLPFLLLLLDYFPLRRLKPSSPTQRTWEWNTGSKSGRKSEPPEVSFWILVREKLPFFALSLVAAVIAFVAQSRGGSVADLEVLSLWRRLDNAVLSYVTYAWRTIYPAGLCVFYPFPANPHSFWMFSAALSGLGSVTLLAALTVRKLPYLAVGWLWYLGTLVPVIGLVQIGGQASADRYSYLPLIGLFLVASWGIADLLERWDASGRAFTVVCLLLPCVLAVPAWRQVQYWRDDTTLFGRALSVTENNFTAHNNLGNILLEQGKHSEAARHLEAALRVRPDSPKAHNNLANVYKDLDRTSEALRHYRLALRAAPDAFQVHFNLAGALARVGRIDEAADHYARAAELEPAIALRVQEQLRALRSLRPDASPAPQLPEPERGTPDVLAPPRPGAPGAGSESPPR
jgi:hypothetical protein